jgi:uncharacterized membrane protein YraQ (UPF0718 family)
VLLRWNGLAIGKPHVKLDSIHIDQGDRILSREKGELAMFFLELLHAGIAALEDYIALHIVTCLIPAFLLAGALVSFVSKESIIHYLGAAAHKLKSFAIAGGGSFFIAACSCTVIPVSGGLYYSGAGIGAAFIVLWVAPATNILAIIKVFGFKKAIVYV